MENIYKELSDKDKKFWFEEMDEWRDRGDRNVFEFPSMIFALGFGGIPKSDTRLVFSEWCKRSRIK